MAVPTGRPLEVIERYFAEFGPVVVSELAWHLSRFRDLRPLLAALGTHAPDESEDQYLVLVNYLRRNGMAELRAKILTLRHDALDRDALDFTPMPLNSLPPVRRDSTTGIPHFNAVRVKPRQPNSTPATPVSSPLANDPSVPGPDGGKAKGKS